MQDLKASPYKLKNAVTVEMPRYIIRNPNTLVRNEAGKLGLVKDVDLEKVQSIKKPLVKIDENQRFGYHKDTPFVIEDRKTGKLAMHFNRNTKAVITAGVKNADPREEIVPAPRVFSKLTDAATALDTNKKVMLLFSKTAQQNLLEQEEIARRNGRAAVKSVLSNRLSRPLITEERATLSL